MVGNSSVLLNPRPSSSSSHKSSLSVRTGGTDGHDKMDDNEKEGKIKQQQQIRFQQFLFLFLLLAVVAFILGTIENKQQPQPPHPNVILSSAEHAAGSNNNNNIRTDSIEVFPEQHNNNKANVQIQKDKSVPLIPQPSSVATIEELTVRVEELDSQVRKYKKSKPGMIMETDPVGMKLTKQLQDVTRQLLIRRYGTDRTRVQVDLIFPKSIPDYTTSEAAKGSFIIEMAPYELIPCSVYYFLEMVRTYKSGSFHRNAGHVLQVTVRSEATKGYKSMPFQEYSSQFPHEKYTTGYAGRPSGPGWYVSILNNTRAHGPGSQQQANPYEADSLFGFLVTGQDDVIPRIHSTKQNGWLDEKNQIQIPKMTILKPKYDDEAADGSKIVDWIPWTQQ